MLRYTYLFILCLFCLLFNGSVYLRVCVCAFNLDGYCWEATIKLNSDSVSILPDSAFRFILDFCLFFSIFLVAFLCCPLLQTTATMFHKIAFWHFIYGMCIWNVTVTFWLVVCTDPWMRRCRKKTYIQMSTHENGESEELKKKRKRQQQHQQTRILMCNAKWFRCKVTGNKDKLHAIRCVKSEKAMQLIERNWSIVKWPSHAT